MVLPQWAEAASSASCAALHEYAKEQASRIHSARSASAAMNLLLEDLVISGFSLIDGFLSRCPSFGSEAGDRSVRIFMVLQ